MKKILIVEDDLLIRGIYRRKFELSGYQVEVAEDGPTALRLVESFKPDVLQVDIQMPGMSGVEVIREVRAKSAFKSTPIIVLSSLYRPDLAKEAWAAGATKCVSKADCTPNLAVDLVEQVLSGETRVFGPGFKPNSPEKIPMPRIAGDTAFINRPSGAKSPPRTTLPKFAQQEHGLLPTESAPALPGRPPAPSSGGPSAPAPAAPGIQEGEPAIPRGTSQTIFITKMMASRKEAAAKTGENPEAPGDPASAQLRIKTGDTKDEPLAPSSGASSEFRLEIRQEFLRRAPQLQADIRDRVGALIRSKSPAEQLTLLAELGSSIASLCSLAGVTGFTRLSHLSGAVDSLIKEIQKKPSQMTSSVLRTIAHAADCLNVLFRELGQVSEEIPQSALILAVDDEPISRRTISIALGKANLRCVALEDPKMALSVVKENPFDLIFLDAEMPGLSGFELCAEIRKLPSNKLTPVIFVTSLTKFEVRAQSSLAGGSDLIAKPFLMMELAVKSLTYLLKSRPQMPKEEGAE